MSNVLVQNYSSVLSVKDTQKAIVLIKDYFEDKLSSNLGLTRVSAPIFVDPLTGLNDNLSGKEPAVSFKTVDGTDLEIVQSLAKWKRYALKKYSMSGLFTDMNAIRKNEVLDNTHSIYVDQWDWEKLINDNDRNIASLKETVCEIFDALKKTETYINGLFPLLNKKLPDDIFFITSQELLDKYPSLSAKEREMEIVKSKKAVFIIGIGSELSDGQSHDLRAPDYDDWSLNGDLFVWDDVLKMPLELSSMGIRVDAKSLENQLNVHNLKNITSYHKAILNDELPLTIGGGIGQSRLSMFLLEKAHIGEVQSSYWPEKDKEIFAKNNIFFL